MKVLSLFSGVGGFDMGLENAGMQTVFQCEWDKHANTILNKHWPHVPKWEDVSTLTGKHILANAPEVDVVAWGSPCQDLSVAGKRAGLEGERSGLFHEGIRIINEIRKETNNEYPKISIWENVAGALSSNRGADFGVILDEMAKAGAMVIEWALLDAQHFGIPQRRRRVFCIAIFNSATASNCPSPLLPVRESLRGDTAKGKPKRKSAANTLTESFGAGGGIVNAIGASIYHKSTVVNQDVNSGHLVVGALAARDYKGVGNQYIAENKCVVEPYLSFDTQFGSNANVFEDQSPTLKASQAAPSVAYGIQGNVIGRQPQNGPAGKGHTEEGDPMFTLTGTDIHAVVYPIDTRNALRDPEKHDAQNRQGLGIGNDGDPMATLTSTHVNAVAYDEYNDSINETHHALRAGTKQSTGVLLEGEVAGTLRSGGAGGVPSSRGEHLVTESTMAVRRLTPLECERLMGWPDDHTRFKADGTEQADTHRYKQCGNGVASPVAEWIGKQLMKLDEATE
jgi:DNA (cytosine-5)-methyltransferase 1